MSRTLDQLLASGDLRRVEPQLGPRRMPQRRLYVTREFDQWAGALSSTRIGCSLLAPIDEINVIAADFVAGAKVVSFIHRIDPPKGAGVLRINTVSCRLAGWAVAPQVMVWALGRLANETHGRGGRLTELGREVVTLRTRLGVTTWAKGEFYELFRAAD